MGFLTYGLLCPFFPWASLAHLFALGFLGPFTSFVFSWAFTDFIGLPSAQLLHTHPWGLWACHQSPTLFACIALGLLRPILTFFTSHTIHGFATHYFSLSGLFWAHLLSQDPFTYSMDLWSIISTAWVNGFFCSLSLANFPVLLSWASFLTFVFSKKKKTLNI